MKGSKISVYSISPRILGLFFFVMTAFALLPEEADARRYASIVIDAESDRVLYERNGDREVYPASLTKVMTLYMMFDALEKGKLTLDQKLKVSRQASRVSPSKLGLKAGQTIRVEDVILAMVTKSANDAAVVAAEALGGTEREFAKLMTAKARALGMTRTTFRNASGLPNSRQTSTVRDLAKLAQALRRNFPAYYPYFSERTFSYNGRSYSNHNRLLRSYSGTDGIKTGYIRASGFNLIASVERNGRRLIAVVVGGKTSRSRDSHMVSLLDQGFTRATQLARRIPEPPGRNPFQLAAAATTPAPTSESDTAAAGESSPETQTTAQADLPTAALPAPRAKPAPVGIGRLGAGIESAAPTPNAEAVTVGRAGSIETVPLPQPPAAAAEPEKGIGKLPPSEPTAQFALATPVPDVAVEPALLQASYGDSPMSARTTGKPEPDGAENIAAASSIWGVQVGAFSGFVPAQNAAATAAQQVPDLLMATRQVVSQIHTAGALLYRAQLHGLTEELAREACRLLSERDLGCVVVPPQMSANAQAGTG